MDYTTTELDMARKGYVYLDKSDAGNGLRKRVRKIEKTPRADLIFDRAAYESRNVTR